MQESYPFGEEQEPTVTVTYTLLTRLFEYFHDSSDFNTYEDIQDITELLFHLHDEDIPLDETVFDYVVGNDSFE